MFIATHNQTIKSWQELYEASREFRERSDAKKNSIVLVLTSIVLIQINKHSQNRVFDVLGIVKYLRCIVKIEQDSEKGVIQLRKAFQEHSIIDHKAA